MRRIILHANKSLLYNSGEPFGKKASSNLFDVTMGSYDGAKSCKLIGTFLLHKITEKYGNSFSLYKGDGLGITNATPCQEELLKKDFCTIFSEHGLKITIEANKQKLSTSPMSLLTYPTVNTCLMLSPRTSHVTSTSNLTTHCRLLKTSQSPSIDSSPRFHITKIHSTKQYHPIKKPLMTADTSTALNFHHQPQQNLQTLIGRIATEITFGKTPHTARM